LFSDEYEHLFAQYPACVVIEEKDFHTDFVSLLRQIETEYLLFGVDDVVYFDSVDFELIDSTLGDPTNDAFGFSLRLSTDRVESGGDTTAEKSVLGESVYSIDWTRGRTPVTRYPFELCATVYRTDLVRLILGRVVSKNPVVRKLFLPDSVLMAAIGGWKLRRRVLKSFGFFFNPNTLESWMCRWCQNHADELPPFVYFQKLCASAIQVNMVNTSTENEAKGSFEHTIRSLAEKYRQGYRLDIGTVENCRPPACHCGQDFFRLVKI
jgi:hypothetical protein